MTVQEMRHDSAGDASGLQEMWHSTAGDASRQCRRCVMTLQEMRYDIT